MDRAAAAQRTSSGGATLTVQADGSVLAGGKNPSPDTYTIVAETDLERITGVRIEVLPDPSLPAGGPGRCFNGNLALAEVALDAAPRERRVSCPTRGLRPSPGRLLPNEPWRLARGRRDRRRSAHGLVHLSSSEQSPHGRLGSSRAVRCRREGRC